MKASPVQLLHVVFEKINVEYDHAHAPAEPPNPLTSAFSFEGVTLHTNVGISEEEQERTGEHLYQVSLELVIDNKKNDEVKDQCFCPYLVNARAVGLVRVPEAASKLAPVYDLALVNGASLLWSALREQICTITARMPVGQILLPSVHFQDLRLPPANQPSAAPLRKAGASRKKTVSA